MEKIHPLIWVEFLLVYRLYMRLWSTIIYRLYLGGQRTTSFTHKSESIAAMPSSQCTLHQWPVVSEVVMRMMWEASSAGQMVWWAFEHQQKGCQESIIPLRRCSTNYLGFVQHLHWKGICLTNLNHAANNSTKIITGKQLLSANNYLLNSLRTALNI